MKKGRGFVIALVLVLSVALLVIAGGPGASSAAAQTYCAPGPCTEGVEEPTIETAVELADTLAGPDTVLITPGTHSVATSGCGGLYVSDESTTLRGAGVGVAILTTPGPNPPLTSEVTVLCGNMHVSDLTLRLPSDVTATNTAVDGLDLYSGTAERIRVDAPGSVYGPGLNDGRAFAGYLRKGVARDIEVDLDPNQDTEGFEALQMEEIADIRSTARNGALSLYIETEPGQAPTRVRGAVLRGRGALTVSNSSTTSKVEVSDAVIDTSMVPPSEQAPGVTVFNGNPPEGIELTLDRATIVGNGAPESAALTVNGQGGLPTTLHASHLAVTGFPRSLVLGRYMGDSLTMIDYSDIDLGPGAIVEEGPSGNPATSFGPGNRTGDPLLSDPAIGNYTPLPGSPAIDIGGPDLLASGPTDLFGNPRPVDGDRDGNALIDAGAVEAPALPPLTAASPTGTAPTASAPPAAKKVSISLVGKKLILTPGGVVKVKLRCPDSEAAPPCKGSVALGTIGKVRFHSKRRRLALGTGRFSLGAGKAGWAPVKLRPAKAALVRSSPIARKVLALVKVGDAAGSKAEQGKAFAIVPAAPRHHRKTPS